MNSGASALFLALKAAEIGHGDTVLLNSFTLSCVPGSIDHAGAKTRLVDTDPDTLVVDLADLEVQIDRHAPKAFILCHMRGRLANVPAVKELCEARGVLLVEDCAHALGGTFEGQATGTFGALGCFSLNAYKQINAGEMGMVVTNCEDLAARTVLFSGAYMMYAQHKAAPDAESPVWHRWKDRVPNYSMRSNEVAAALALPQLAGLRERNARWLVIHDAIAGGLRAAVPDTVRLPRHVAGAAWTPTSVQFWVDEPPLVIERMLALAGAEGVSVKWFGCADARGFTSAHRHWGWVEGHDEVLPGNAAAITNLCEVRLPYTLTDEDCVTIVEVIRGSLSAARECHFL